MTGTGNDTQALYRRCGSSVWWRRPAHGADPIRPVAFATSTATTVCLPMAPPAMTDDEFEEFLGVALDELAAKQQQLMESYELGSYASFWFDQEQGSLDFRDAGGATQLRATVIPVGSWSPGSDTWMWAWANESLLPPLREQSKPLQELACVTGLDVFENRGGSADEKMAWELTAMAVRHLKARGAYRAPGQSSHLYLAITSCQKVGPEGWRS